MSACIGPMKANGRGVILNIASIASSAGIADRFAYSMSKGAVLAMTYSVAKDYCVITSGAIAFRRREYARRLWKISYGKTTQGANTKHLRNSPAHNRSADGKALRSSGLGALPLF